MRRARLNARLTLNTRVIGASWVGFFRVASRPRWIAALLFSLLVAAAFAFLGQWQLERSVTNASFVEADTETPKPLSTVGEPGKTMADAAVGQRVYLSGRVVAGDFVVLSGRDNNGETGSWLVAHVLTEEGFSLAVGLGWAPRAELAREAQAAVSVGQLRLFAGRYLPAESPELDDFAAGESRALSIAALVNIWADPAPVYPGYLVLADPAPGLLAIHQPPPFRELSFNWLNLFYALEWVIFAGFAIYLWYRVVRDVWEKEAQDLTNYQGGVG